MNGVIFLKDGSQIAIPHDAIDVSDGSHSFRYHFRVRSLLFIKLASFCPEMCWKSKHNEDGTLIRDGKMFLAGLRAPSGDVSFHFPVEYWNQLSMIETKGKAPSWDGHTAMDVCDRLEAWEVGGLA